MNRQQLDDFCARFGSENNMDGDDKWQTRKPEFCITRAVQRQSRFISQMVSRPAKTANFFTAIEDSEDANASYNTGR